MTRRRKLADSPSTQYRYCLDAMLATIKDVEEAAPYSLMVKKVLRTARYRAAELAGRIAEREGYPFEPVKRRRKRAKKKI